MEQEENPQIQHPQPEDQEDNPQIQHPQPEDQGQQQIIEPEEQKEGTRFKALRLAVSVYPPEATQFDHLSEGQVVYALCQALQSCGFLEIDKVFITDVKTGDEIIEKVAIIRFSKKHGCAELPDLKLKISKGQCKMKCYPSSFFEYPQETSLKALQKVTNSSIRLYKEGYTCFKEWPPKALLNEVRDEVESAVNEGENDREEILSRNEMDLADTQLDDRSIDSSHSDDGFEVVVDRDTDTITFFVDPEAFRDGFTFNCPDQRRIRIRPSNPAFQINYPVLE